MEPMRIDNVKQTTDDTTQADPEQNFACFLVARCRCCCSIRRGWRLFRHRRRRRCRHSFPRKEPKWQEEKLLCPSVASKMVWSNTRRRSLSQGSIRSSCCSSRCFFDRGCWGAMMIPVSFNFHECDARKRWMCHVARDVSYDPVVEFLNHESE